jgi:hypothetical protein
MCAQHSRPSAHVNVYALFLCFCMHVYISSASAPYSTQGPLCMYVRICLCMYDLRVLLVVCAGRSSVCIYMVQVHICVYVCMICECECECACAVALHDVLWYDATPDIWLCILCYLYSSIWQAVLLFHSYIIAVFSISLLQCCWNLEHSYSVVGTWSTVTVSLELGAQCLG